MQQGKVKAKRSALGFYGSEDCIVTGPARDPQSESLRVHWHHLDEVGTNWIAENIVRLRGDFNNAIEMHRRNPKLALPKEVTPDALRDLSLRDYGNGFFASGYGCARLGSFIALNHCKNWDKAVELATCAFLNLRPLGKLDFAVDTFERTVFEILKVQDRRRQIQARSLSELVFEVGTYFIDYGLPAVYLMWKAYAEALLERTVLLKDDKGLRARILQHQGIGLITLGESVQGRELLAKALEVYPTCSPRGGAANDAMWRLKEAVHSRDLDIGEELAATLKKMQITPDVCYWTGKVRTPAAVGWWILGEALGKLADVHLIKGELSMADEFAAAASRVYQEKRIQPGATFPSAALESFRKRYAATPTGVIVERRPEALAAFAAEADKLRTILRADGMIPEAIDPVKYASRQLDV